MDLRRTLTIANWAVSAALFTAFLFWNGAFEGPLSPDEVAYYKARIPEMNPSLDMEQITTFLETDDGGPFYVVNNVKYYDTPQTTKEDMKGKTNEEIAQPYADYWLSFVLPRGSYPIYAGKPIIDAFENRGVENGAGWTDAIVVRYRSRRVFAEMITDPGFNDFHDLKYITTEKSIALPTTSQMHLVNLEYFVALLLLSISLSLQLVINSRHSKDRTRAASVPA